LEVDFFSIKGITFSQLTPLLDELDKFTGSINIRRVVNISAPSSELAGIASRDSDVAAFSAGTEVAVLIGISWQVLRTPVGRAILDEVLKNEPSVLRRLLVRMLDEARHFAKGCDVPLDVRIGHCHFYLEEGWTEDEVQQRMSRADEFVQSLPESVRNDQRQDGEIAFTWDKGKAQWRTAEPIIKRKGRK